MCKKFIILIAVFTVISVIFTSEVLAVDLQKHQNGSGFYEYGPSIVEFDSTTRYSFYTGNNGSGSSDKIVRADGSFDGKQWSWGTGAVVLLPTNGSWDSANVCNPEIIKGSFSFDGTTYAYAMLYQGNDHKNGKHYQIGIAFSNSLTEGTWVKLSSPLITYKSSNCWGVGNPSAAAINENGSFMLFYTRKDPNGTGMRCVQIDLTNADKPILGNEMILPTAGLTEESGSVTLDDGDVSYDSSRDMFLLVRNRYPLDNSIQPSDISKSIQIAEIPENEITEANGTWTVLGNITSNITSKQRNYGGAIVTDAKGHITGYPDLSVAFSVCDAGSGYENTRRLYISYFNINYEYNLKYSGNTGDNHYVQFTGVKPDEDINPANLDFNKVQSIFHPRVWLDNDTGRTDLFQPESNYNIGTIYTPVLIDRGTYWDCLYGGWEMNNEPWGAGYRGATDKLYMAPVNDYSLGSWTDSNTSASKKLVLSSNYGTGGDNSLYHINDPSLVDLGNGHYRIYFEMESINDIASFGDNPMEWKAPNAGEYGIPVHNIAYSESFDYGATWNSPDFTGKVDRRYSIKIEGLTSADYAYYQIGWPSVIQYGGKYLMYFNAFPRGGTDQTAKTITVAKSYEELNNGQKSTYNGPVPNHNFTGNLLLAESTDGINFTFKGEVKDKYNGTVYAYNPDIKIVGNGPEAMMVYGGLTYEWGSFIPKYPGQWATGVSYFDLSSDESRLRMEFINPAAVWSLDTKTVPVYPAPFNPDYSDVTPQWIIKAGKIIGFGYGQWHNPYADHAWLTCAFLQKSVKIKNSSGNVIAEYNTAVNEDTLYVSHNSWYYEGTPWIVLQGNNGNPNRNTVIDNGSIEVYGIHGDLLAKLSNTNVTPGDSYEVYKAWEKAGS